MHWERVTRRQGGLIARRQLFTLGLNKSAVDQLLAGRRLEPTPTDGVYRAAGAPATPETAAWFAVLASRSPISFSTAGRWWDLPVEDDGLVHITRFDRRRLDWPRGVRVHRVHLRIQDMTEHRGMPVTTRVETLLDCIGSMPFAAASTLADRAAQQRWLRPEDIHRRLDDQPGRWGNKRLGRVLSTMGDGAAAESERRLHRLLRDAGILGWTAGLSVRIAGRRFEIDVAFAAQRIAIEVDGRRYHSGDIRFQADRTKQNALISAGWRVLRFTWNDLVQRPHDVIDHICALLAA